MAATEDHARLPQRHWNIVTFDGSVPGEEMLELIDHSYDLVVHG